ncbi:MAG TPA: hypothetical protein DDZ89_02845 [Clostridiales bacterium]|nr:hypothetical protein [Clostridiales bacterium]
MKRYLKIQALILIFCLLCSCSSVTLENDADLSETTVESSDIKNDDYIRLSLLVNYFKDRNPDMVKVIVEELNVLSTSTIGVYMDYILLDDNTPYEKKIQSMINSVATASGQAIPDLFFADSLYGLNYPEMHGRDDLIYYITQNAVTDLSEYITEKTPSIKAIFEKYPEMEYMSRINGKLYGVPLYENFMKCPVLMIKKSLSKEHSDYTATDIYEALDVCKTISDATESANIYVDPKAVLKAMMYQQGYYSVYFSQAYSYLAKYGDDICHVERFEQTELFDQIHIMKNDFIKYDMKTFYRLSEITEDMDIALLASSDHISELVFASMDSIITNYDFYYLYNEPPNIVNGIQMQYPYFVVSESCEKKEKAVQYIDWLHSNMQARKLIGFGIEDVNYKFNHIDNYLYYDYALTLVQLVNIGPGGAFTLATDRLSKDTNHINYVKERLVENMVMQDLTKLLVSNSNNLDRFHEESGRIHEKFRSVINEESKGLREVKRMFRLDQILEDDVTLENVEYVRKLLEETYNEEYLDEINALICSLQR